MTGDQANDGSVGKLAGAAHPLGAWVGKHRGGAPARPGGRGEARRTGPDGERVGARGKRSTAPTYAFFFRPFFDSMFR